MLLSLVGEMGFWRWIVLGLLLLAVELVAPGTVLLWLGLAAIVVGAIVFVFDPGWQVEVVAFAVFALGAAVGWWFLGRPDNAAASDRPMLNRRAERHVGRRFVLAEPIAGGEGRVRIDDTVWRVRGPDLPAGVEIAVVAAEGATLVVEPAARA
ncbi:NfeD family protein [Methylopila turkensis]|uniref:Membrane protein n=1 Tax=Methylopila turkensis TaxID=1437816 RepID=A0A9W6N7I1_9HYPH|nr:NfeD family protein [Methylopila turkensis]GLK80442.1 membrane protein [Methylopila turkensis]